MAVMWLALRWHRIGGRWPEQTAFVLVCLPEVAIAWMIPRSGDSVEAYLLGLSLAIYTTAFLIVWRWQLTAMLVAVTAGATAAFSLGVEPGLTTAQVTTMVFYLGTAAVLAIAAQIYRYRKGWQQFVTQAALEEERRRNEVLVAGARPAQPRGPTHIGRQPPGMGGASRRRGAASADGRVEPMSVIVGDLDHFKSVNDGYGHAVGDVVLRMSAALLADRVRSTDFVARLGGDEFGIVCPDTPLAAAERLATELAARARSTNFPSGVAMTFSLGVAELCPDDSDPAAFLHRADAALYAAKASRDTVRSADASGVSVVGCSGSGRPAAPASPA